jgi:hypothetical protein
MVNGVGVGVVEVVVGGVVVVVVVVVPSVTCPQDVNIPAKMMAPSSITPILLNGPFIFLLLIKITPVPSYS